MYHAVHVLRNLATRYGVVITAIRLNLAKFRMHFNLLVIRVLSQVKFDHMGYPGLECTHAVAAPSYPAVDVAAWVHPGYGRTVLRRDRRRMK